MEPLAAVPHQQIVRAAVGGAALTWQPVDAAGEPADAGTVTVTVTRSDGTELRAAGTATSGSGTAPRTVALTIAELADLDVLSAVWSADGVELARTTAEIVGRPWMSVAELRAATYDVDDVRYPPDRVRSAIARVEREFERICGGPWVPRFRVYDRVGTGTCRMALPEKRLRSVRWGHTWDGVLELSNLTAVGASPAGIALRSDGTAWPSVRLLLGCEVGADGPPPDLLGAFAARVADVLWSRTSGLPDRVASISGGDQTFQIARPGQWGNWTGIADVDEILRDYADPRVAAG